MRSYSAMDIADMAQLARRQLRLAIDAVGLLPPSTAAVAYTCAQAASNGVDTSPVPDFMATAA